MIEVRDLTKRYGEKLAVDNLSFTVEAGRVTGFLGPNGAGKSTTMRMMIGLDRPGEDYTGGEFMMVEQRPRAQSKGLATLLPQGHGLVFTTRERPVETKRGWSAAPMRHGVSPIRSGRRHTLGLVFHDAA